MRKVALAILVLFWLSASNFLQPLYAQSTPELYITNIWARPTTFESADESMDGMNMDATQEADMDMAGMDDMQMAIPPSAIYMTIINPTNEVVRLVSVDTPFATTQLHETTIENEVMQMREIEGGITILEGEQVRLEQGGLHIMLIELTRELLPGDALPLTLNFISVTTETTFSIVTAAPVLEGAPTINDTIIISGAWARATLIGDMPATEEHAGMDMGNMEATEEAGMDGMDEMSMSIPPSAIYMTITNLGENNLNLIEIRSAVTQTAQIHETSLENDVMRMRELENGLIIPAGGNVLLEQGGYHIMMMALTRELVASETVVDAISVTLIFDDGTEITIGVPVLENAASLNLDE
ncbi:MAG: copper chaperone PCu(A)C [Aggregatilineales bacterium]